MIKTCASCDYSVPIEGEDGMLECRRRSIEAVGIDEEGAILCTFPSCEPSMWCGDYKHTIRLSGPSNYAMDW